MRHPEHFCWVTQLFSSLTGVMQRNVPTRLAAGAVGSDFHQVGLHLKPQLVGLQAVTEPQFGYICSIKAQRIPENIERNLKILDQKQFRPVTQPFLIPPIDGATVTAAATAPPAAQRAEAPLNSARVLTLVPGGPDEEVLSVSEGDQPAWSRFMLFIS